MCRVNRSDHANCQPFLFRIDYNCIVIHWVAPIPYLNPKIRSEKYKTNPKNRSFELNSSPKGAWCWIYTYNAKSSTVYKVPNNTTSAMAPKPRSITKQLDHQANNTNRANLHEKGYWWSLQWSSILLVGISSSESEYARVGI